MGAPFNPPLGRFEPPTTQIDPRVIVEQLIAALARSTAQGLGLDPGCAMREGEPWIAVVIVQVGDDSWYVSPTTARAVADCLGRWPARHILAVHFDDPEAVAASFVAAADAAEDLAAGRTPSRKQEELH